MAEPRYTPVAISLHWLVAVGVLGGFGLGLYMVVSDFGMKAFIPAVSDDVRLLIQVESFKD